MNIMEHINGYKFSSLEEAQEAMTQLNTHWGLPVANGVSKFGEWSLYIHPDAFYWIHANEWTAPLGTSVEIFLPEYPI